MSRRNRLIRHLIDRWTQRFGEPPPIRTDPELMRTVLESCEPRARLVKVDPAAPSPT